MKEELSVKNAFTKYPNLFSPITIRGQILKNRLIAAPHGMGPRTLDNAGNGHQNFNDTAAEYYGAIARGGAALVYTNECNVDPRIGTILDTFNFFEESGVRSMRLLTHYIHAYGAKAGMELNHKGAVSTPIGGPNSLCGSPLAGTEIARLGPCDAVLPNGNVVKGMTEADMDEIADYFASAAEKAQRGGFDAVMVHAGHGWLLAQFLSPYYNHRTDDYGGSPENRARFPKMVLDRIRQRVGKNMILDIRFSGADLIEGGNTIEDGVRIAKVLAQSADILHVSAGVLIPRGMTSSEMVTFDTHWLKHGCNTYLAEEIKKHVSIPVTTLGGINTPEDAEALLARGAVDLVATARSFIADPDWGQKARSGREEDIRPCIRCLKCMNAYVNRDSECSVNATKGWAHMDARLPKAEAARKVIVVGGGPAGMEAALKCAERGHYVTLYEKQEQLGGLLHFADHMVFKEDIRRFYEFQAAQCRKHPRISVITGKEATPELVRAQEPDAVIVAIGAEPLTPPIAGVEQKNVWHTMQVFGNEARLGERVLIVGGGTAACELAIHLSLFGKKPILVEMAKELMPTETNKYDKFSVLHFLNHTYDYQTAHLNNAPEVPDKTEIHTGTRCVAISGTHVTVQDADGEHTIEADDIVLSAGFRIDQKQHDAFYNTAPDVIFVGNCYKIGEIYNAVHTGYTAAYQVY